MEYGSEGVLNMKLKSLKESLFIKTVAITILIYAFYLIYSYIFNETGFRFSEKQGLILIIIAIAGNTFNLIRDIKKR